MKITLEKITEALEHAARIRIAILVGGEEDALESQSRVYEILRELAHELTLPENNFLFIVGDWVILESTGEEGLICVDFLNGKYEVEFDGQSRGHYFAEELKLKTE